MSGDTLRKHLEQGRAALAADPVDRVHAALTVLPLLVEDLNRLCAQDASLRELRADLLEKVTDFRVLVRQVQGEHPEVTFKSGHVQRAARELDAVLGKLLEAIDP